jgi:Holliday junction resolvasome RuvABC endonuclease subunit
MAIRSGGILSLDLATTIGWAVCTPEYVHAWSPGLVIPDGSATQYGLLNGYKDLRLYGSDLGAKLDAFILWLDEMIKVHDPRVLVFEAPFVQTTAGKVNLNTARLLMSMSGIAEALASRHGLKSFECNVTRVKEQACGTKNAQKPEITKAARDKGWGPKDENAADALWALDATIENLRSR